MTAAALIVVAATIGAVGYMLHRQLAAIEHALRDKPTPSGTPYPQRIVGFVQHRYRRNGKGRVTDRPSEATMPDLAYPVVTDTEFPHGLACTACHRPIEVGQPYTDRFVGMVNADDTVTELVCVYCDTITRHKGDQ